MVNPATLPTGPQGSSDVGPKQIAVIGIALGVGIAMFAAIALAYPFFLGGGEGALPDGAADPTLAPPPEGEDALPMLALLSLVHLVIAVGAWATALLLGSRLADTARRTGAPDGLQRAYVVKWAMCEGPALFGVVIVLLGGMGGDLPGQAHYYANLITAGAFLALVAFDVSRLLTARERY